MVYSFLLVSTTVISCHIFEQGLADVFMKLRTPFESDEARLLNHEIMETIC